ncbi:MAG TPA: glycosyltransferase family 4 protein, partial [Acidothermaceae bacterium]
MHVMFTVAEMGSGGAEAVVSTLARDVAARGARVTVASSGGWRAAELDGQGARLVSVPLRGRRPLDLARAAIALRRERIRASVSLLHAHNVKAAVVSAAGWPNAFPRGGQRVPLVVTLHGVPTGRYRDAARILNRCADHVVAVSTEVAERVVTAGFPSSRTQVIENAVVAPEAHDRIDARRRLGIACDARVVVCVARLAPQKRHDLLVAAWQQMPADAVLLIVGEGVTRPAVDAAIGRTGQRDRIRLLGERHDVDWLLAAADACVLPTDWEGLPISVLEAMAAGVPVVASAVTGLAAFGAAIQLVPPGSATALADGLRHVLADESRRRKLITAGLALARDRFAPARMCEQYRDLYAAVGMPVPAAPGGVA